MATPSAHFNPKTKLTANCPKGNLTSVNRLSGSVNSDFLGDMTIRASSHYHNAYCGTGFANCVVLCVGASTGGSGGMIRGSMQAGCKL